MDIKYKYSQKELQYFRLINFYISEWTFVAGRNVVITNYFIQLGSNFLCRERIACVYW